MDDETERVLRRIAAERHMTLRGLLGAIVLWFARLDRTQQALVLGQVEPADMALLVKLAARRPKAQGPDK